MAMYLRPLYRSGFVEAMVAAGGFLLPFWSSFFAYDSSAELGTHEICSGERTADMVEVEV